MIESSQPPFCQTDVSGSASVDLFGQPIIKNELLKDRFGEVPFTILDSRSGNWKKRKQKWLKLNIKSEVGRKDLNVYGFAMAGLRITKLQIITKDE